MSKQPEEIQGWAATLATSWTEIEGLISIPKLHTAYMQEWWAEGMQAPVHGSGQAALRSWMEGSSEPSGTELVFVLRALNKIRAKLDLPLLPEVPLPRSSGGTGGGARVDSARGDGAKGGPLSVAA